MSTVPARRYDVALLDLDGVLYLGPTPISGAAAALAAARAAGMRLAFVTNNASRTAEAVAERLSDMGVQADPGEVVTSAQAACHVLAERLPAGAAVLVVGGEGLHREAAERGFKVVTSADDEPAAVVQGYGADVGWKELAEATVAVRRDAWWVATNLDPTLPSVRGPLPGNGALVGLVRGVTGIEPQVAGKPDPAMHRESVQRSGARDPIVVGDRLDTDIEGASRVGCDSLLVLTGVTGPADLLGAPPEWRPTYVCAGLEGLLEEYEAPERSGDGWTCGGWTVTGDLVLSGDGEDLAALRALCAAAWAGSPDSGSPRQVRADGPAAAAALERLDLAP